MSTESSEEVPEEIFGRGGRMVSLDLTAPWEILASHLLKTQSLSGDMLPKGDQPPLPLLEALLPFQNILVQNSGWKDFYFNFPNICYFL